MKELTSFCDHWLQSWSGNKPEKLIEFYSDDAFYLDPANPQGIQGKEKIFLYFQKLLAKNPNWIWQREILLPTEEGFCLIWKAQVPELVRGMDRIVITNGTISRNEVYFDTKNIFMSKGRPTSFSS